MKNENDRDESELWKTGEEYLPIRLAGMIFLNKKYYCACCGLEVKGFRDRLSAQEFRISQTCQSCQDQLFKEIKDEDET
jgi:hypothetical protein